MSDEPGVTITFREIYDQIVGLRDDVRSVIQSREDTDKRLTDHEERIRSVERWKYSVPAALATSVLAAGASIIKASGLI